MKSTVNNDENLLKQSAINLSKVQINIRKQSIWQGNKVKILSAVTVLTTTVITLAVLSKYYSKGCVDGFYDDLSMSYCEDGVFKQSTRLSMIERCYEKYYNLIESCKRGDKILGCFHKNYYRELTPECKTNPLAKLCDGNYDHAEWVKGIYNWLNSSSLDPEFKHGS